MPYNAIDPFRATVERILQYPQPRPADPAPNADDNGDARIALEPRYYGTVTFVNNVSFNPGPPPVRSYVTSTQKAGTHTVSEFSYEGGLVADWQNTQVLDYQGGDADYKGLSAINPAGKFGPDEQFVSVTQLPDGAMGQFLPSRPDGLLRVTMQMDVWHAWRVAAEDLADAVSRVLDGGVAPGLASIQSGVRATAYEPGEVKWRVSQRFAITAYDEG